MQDSNSRLNSYDDPGYHEYMKSPNLEQFANDSKPSPYHDFGPRGLPDGKTTQPSVYKATLTPQELAGMTTVFKDGQLVTLKERCERVTLIPTGNEDDLPY